VIPVVLDVDTGVDDALALLFAARHPELDLRAVSCVAGNVGVDQVVVNTLTVLEAAGAPDVPVARGAAAPLVQKPAPLRPVHGVDGLGDVGWPPSGRLPDERPAVELLRAELTAGPPITLIALAPLTNIALLLRTYPEVVDGIARFVFMGGSAGLGNATPGAEFNIWHDPEAAAIVLDVLAGSATPVTMYGLDVYYEPAASAAHAEELSQAADPGARLAGQLVRYRLSREPGDATTIGDAGAVCAVADQDGLRAERLPIQVELTGTWTRGQTVVDRRPMPADPAPAIDVALDVAGRRYVDLWRSTVLGPG
jgi:pyrimidine-specific ribonucleoside hydrolase